MNARRDVVDYLRDILDAAESALSFIATPTVDTFVVDKKTVFAVVRALEIIGEATKRLPEPLRSATPRSRGVQWPGCATS